jgi:hypothetical protein
MARRRTEEIDVVEVDIEVEGGSVKADVVVGMFGVVVDSTDPAEVQALNTRTAAMATPATHGRRLASTTPSDQRRGLTATPKTPCITWPDHPNLRLRGVGSHRTSSHRPSKRHPLGS